MRKGWLKLVLSAACALAAAILAQEAAPAVPEHVQSQTLTWGSPWEVFLRGGSFMWLLLLAFLAGLALALERLRGLKRRQHVPKGFDKDVVHVVDTRGLDAGMALCQEKPSSLGRVLHAALLRHGTGRQEMEDAVTDEVARVLYDLRRNTRALSVLAILAAPLGLLGTCVALIEVAAQAAGTSPLQREAVAAGVAGALLPTAFGLLVAILLCGAYFHLKGKAEDLAREIDERGKDAVITLDRKARQSIRLIEDLEEHIPTKDMPAIKEPPADLAKEIELSAREGSGIKTSITTPVNLPAAAPPPDADAGKKPPKS
ncbi:MAG: MotA/TolQ/ExbB proton channel family protein [Planctomycetota bacterium]